MLTVPTWAMRLLTSMGSSFALVYGFVRGLRRSSPSIGSSIERRASTPCVDLDLFGE